MTENSRGESYLGRHPAETLERWGLAPRTDAGQNFLVLPEALDRVVDAAAVQLNEPVLEIGTGLGRLTARLARKAAYVVSVEIDSGLHRAASEHLSCFHNVCLVHGDFLDTKHRINPVVTEAAREAREKTGRPLKVVSNLPYSISSPALVCMMEWEAPLLAAYVMIQTEVAKRLTTRPGSREYGPLSVIMDYWAQVRQLFKMPPGAFWPSPKVTSSFLEVAPRAAPEQVERYDIFCTVVNALFQQRRKTLVHVLRAQWGNDAVERVLEETDVDPAARAGTLTTMNFVAVANVLARAEGR